MKKKFIITASETVYYWKEVEAESESEVYDLISQGYLYFTNDDITEADHFDIHSIQEVEIDEGIAK